MPKELNQSPKNSWEENTYDEVGELIRLASDGEVDIYPEKYERVKSFIRYVEARAREYGYKACMENVRKFHEENKPKFLKSINK